MAVRDLSGKRPAGAETADLSVKKETTEEDSDDHTLALPVQRKKQWGEKKQTSIINLSTLQSEYPGATTVSTLLPWR